MAGLILDGYDPHIPQTLPSATIISWKTKQKNDYTGINPPHTIAEARDCKIREIASITAMELLHVN